MAFGAMLLASVLFLTAVWHESVLTAGLMIAPGPAMAAAFSVPSSKLSARYGERVTGAVGAVLFASGGVFWLSALTAAPDYAGAFLPGMIIGGAGVGLVIPTLFAAASASLPPARFATGSAILSMSRQIGVALGVAVLVSLIGDPARGDALSRFQDGWAFMLGAALAAAVALVSMGRVGEPAGAPAPEPALAAVGEPA
jgi:MFS family permease